LQEEKKSSNLQRREASKQATLSQASWILIGEEINSSLCYSLDVAIQWFIQTKPTNYEVGDGLRNKDHTIEEAHKGLGNMANPLWWWHSQNKSPTTTPW
jgi:hypothetical protein